MEMVRRIVLASALLAVSGAALAQTSSFSAEASGVSEPVPTLVAQDVQQPDGRIEVTIAPDSVVPSGSQRILMGTDWGLWTWDNRIHGHFYTTDGERQLFRLEASAIPLPGTEVVAGQPVRIDVSWTPAGVGVFVDDELRLYLEGSYRTPPGDLFYGADANGDRPYSGSISVGVFAEPLSFDPCTNYPTWGHVTNSSGQAVPPQPTCATPPDDEPGTVVNGIATADLSWSRPTENEDGSVLLAAEIVGYSIFFGEQSRVGRCADRPTVRDDNSCYVNVMEIGGGGETQQVVFSIDKDTSVYFSMATIAQNDEGEDLLSRYSSEVARGFIVNVEDLPDPVPNVPSGINVNITVTAECTTDDGKPVPCNIEVVDQ